MARHSQSVYINAIQKRKQYYTKSGLRYHRAIDNFT